MGTQVLAGAPVSRKPPMRLPTTRGDRGYWRWRGSLVNHKVLMCLPSRGLTYPTSDMPFWGDMLVPWRVLSWGCLVPVGDWHSFVGAVWWSFVHGSQNKQKHFAYSILLLKLILFLDSFSPLGEFVQREWVSNITIHLRWLLFLNFQSDKKQLQTTYRKPTCSYFQPLQFQVCRSCLVVCSTWMCRMAAGSPF